MQALLQRRVACAAQREDEVKGTFGYLLAAEASAGHVQELQRLPVLAVAELATSYGLYDVAAAAASKSTALGPQTLASALRVLLVRCAVQVQAAMQLAGAAAAEASSVAVALALRALLAAQQHVADPDMRCAAMYNASLFHWMAVRPLLRDGTFYLAVPSLKAVTRALLVCADASSQSCDHTWLARQFTALAMAQAELGHKDEAKAALQAACEQAHAAAALRGELQAPTLPRLLEDILRVRVHVAGDDEQALAGPVAATFSGLPAAQRQHATKQAQALLQTQRILAQLAGTHSAGERNQYDVLSPHQAYNALLDVLWQVDPAFARDCMSQQHPAAAQARWTGFIDEYVGTAVPDSKVADAELVAEAGQLRCARVVSFCALAAALASLCTLATEAATRVRTDPGAGAEDMVRVELAEAIVLARSVPVPDVSATAAARASSATSRVGALWPLEGPALADAVVNGRGQAELRDLPAIQLPPLRADAGLGMSDVLNDALGSTPADARQVQRARAIAACKVVQQAIQRASSAGDAASMELAACVAWSTVQPLLRAGEYRATRDLLVLAASALSKIASPLIQLRTRLHVEAARADLAADFAVAAAAHVTQALALDYAEPDNASEAAAPHDASFQAAELRVNSAAAGNTSELLSVPAQAGLSHGAQAAGVRVEGQPVASGRGQADKRAGKKGAAKSSARSDTAGPPTTSMGSVSPAVRSAVAGLPAALQAAVLCVTRQPLVLPADFAAAAAAVDQLSAPDDRPSTGPRGSSAAAVETAAALGAFAGIEMLTDRAGVTDDMSATRYLDRVALPLAKTLQLRSALYYSADKLLEQLENALEAIRVAGPGTREGLAQLARVLPMFVQAARAASAHVAADVGWCCGDDRADLSEAELQYAQLQSKDDGATALQQLLEPLEVPAGLQELLPGAAPQARQRDLMEQGGVLMRRIHRLWAQFAAVAADAGHLSHAIRAVRVLSRPIWPVLAARDMALRAAGAWLRGVDMLARVFDHVYAVYQTDEDRARGRRAVRVLRGCLPGVHAQAAPRATPATRLGSSAPFVSQMQVDVLQVWAAVREARAAARARESAVFAQELDIADQDAETQAHDAAVTAEQLWESANRDELFLDDGVLDVEAAEGVVYMPADAPAIGDALVWRSLAAARAVLPGWQVPGTPAPVQVLKHNLVQGSLFACVQGTLLRCPDIVCAAAGKLWRYHAHVFDAQLALLPGQPDWAGSADLYDMEAAHEPAALATARAHPPLASVDASAGWTGGSGMLLCSQLRWALVSAAVCTACMGGSRSSSLLLQLVEAAAAAARAAGIAALASCDHAAAAAEWRHALAVAALPWRVCCSTAQLREDDAHVRAAVQAVLNMEELLPPTGGDRDRQLWAMARQALLQAGALVPADLPDPATCVRLCALQAELRLRLCTSPEPAGLPATLTALRPDSPAEAWVQACQAGWAVRVLDTAAPAEAAAGCDCGAGELAAATACALLASLPSAGHPARSALLGLIDPHVELNSEQQASVAAAAEAGAPSVLPGCARVLACLPMLPPLALSSLASTNDQVATRIALQAPLAAQQAAAVSAGEQAVAALRLGIAGRALPAALHKALGLGAGLGHVIAPAAASKSGASKSAGKSAQADSSSSSGLLAVSMRAMRKMAQVARAVPLDQPFSPSEASWAAACALAWLDTSPDGSGSGPQSHAAAAALEAVLAAGQPVPGAEATSKKSKTSLKPSSKAADAGSEDDAAAAAAALATAVGGYLPCSGLVLADAARRDAEAAAAVCEALACAAECCGRLWLLVRSQELAATAARAAQACMAGPGSPGARTAAGRRLHAAAAAASLLAGDAAAGTITLAVCTQVVQGARATDSQVHLHQLTPHAMAQLRAHSVAQYALAAVHAAHAADVGLAQAAAARALGVATPLAGHPVTRAGLAAPMAVLLHGMWHAALGRVSAAPAGALGTLVPTATTPARRGPSSQLPGWSQVQPVITGAGAALAGDIATLWLAARLDSHAYGLTAQETMAVFGALPPSQHVKLWTPRIIAHACIGADVTYELSQLKNAASGGVKAGSKSKKGKRGGAASGSSDPLLHGRLWLALARAVHAPAEQLNAYLQALEAMQGYYASGRVLEGLAEWTLERRLPLSEVRMRLESALDVYMEAVEPRAAEPADADADDETATLAGDGISTVGSRSARGSRAASKHGGSVRLGTSHSQVGSRRSAGGSVFGSRPGSRTRSGVFGAATSVRTRSDVGSVVSASDAQATAFTDWPTVPTVAHVVACVRVLTRLAILAPDCASQAAAALGAVYYVEALWGMGAAAANRSAAERAAFGLTAAQRKVLESSPGGVDAWVEEQVDARSPHSLPRSPDEWLARAAGVASHSWWCTPPYVGQTAVPGAPLPSTAGGDGWRLFVSAAAGASRGGANARQQRVMLSKPDLQVFCGSGAASGQQAGAPTGTAAEDLAPLPWPAAPVTQQAAAHAALLNAWRNLPVAHMQSAPVPQSVDAPGLLWTTLRQLSDVLHAVGHTAAAAPVQCLALHVADSCVAWPDAAQLRAPGVLARLHFARWCQNMMMDGAAKSLLHSIGAVSQGQPSLSCALAGSAGSLHCALQVPAPATASCAAVLASLQQQSESEAVAALLRSGPGVQAPAVLLDAASAGASSPEDGADVPQPAEQRDQQVLQCVLGVLGMDGTDERSATAARAVLRAVHAACALHPSVASGPCTSEVLAFRTEAQLAAEAKDHGQAVGALRDADLLGLPAAAAPDEAGPSPRLVAPSARAVWLDVAQALLDLEHCDAYVGAWLGAASEHVQAFDDKLGAFRIAVMRGAVQYRAGSALNCVQGISRALGPHLAQARALGSAHSGQANAAHLPLQDMLHAGLAMADALAWARRQVDVRLALETIAHAMEAHIAPPVLNLGNAVTRQANAAASKRKADRELSMLIAGGGDTAAALALQMRQHTKSGSAVLQAGAGGSMGAALRPLVLPAPLLLNFLPEDCRQVAEQALQQPAQRGTAAESDGFQAAAVLIQASEGYYRANLPAYLQAPAAADAVQQAGPAAMHINLAALLSAARAHTAAGSNAAGQALAIRAGGADTWRPVWRRAVGHFVRAVALAVPASALPIAMQAVLALAHAMLALPGGDSSWWSSWATALSAELAGPRDKTAMFGQRSVGIAAAASWVSVLSSPAAVSPTLYTSALAAARARRDVLRQASSLLRWAHDELCVPWHAATCGHLTLADSGMGMPAPPAALLLGSVRGVLADVSCALRAVERQCVLDAATLWDTVLAGAPTAKYLAAEGSAVEDVAQAVLEARGSSELPFGITVAQLGDIASLLQVDDSATQHAWECTVSGLELLSGGLPNTGIAAGMLRCARVLLFQLPDAAVASTACSWQDLAWWPRDTAALLPTADREAEPGADAPEAPLLESKSDSPGSQPVMLRAVAQWLQAAAASAGADAAPASKPGKPSKGAASAGKPATGTDAASEPPMPSIQRLLKEGVLGVVRAASTATGGLPPVAGAIASAAGLVQRVHAGLFSVAPAGSSGKQAAKPARGESALSSVAPGTGRLPPASLAAAVLPALHTSSHLLGGELMSSSAELAAACVALAPFAFAQLPDLDQVPDWQPSGLACDALPVQWSTEARQRWQQAVSLAQGALVLALFDQSWAMVSAAAHELAAAAGTSAPELCAAALALAQHADVLQFERSAALDDGRHAEAATAVLQLQGRAAGTLHPRAGDGPGPAVLALRAAEALGGFGLAAPGICGQYDCASPALALEYSWRHAVAVAAPADAADVACCPPAAARSNAPISAAASLSPSGRVQLPSRGGAALPVRSMWQAWWQLHAVLQPAGSVLLQVSLSPDGRQLLAAASFADPSNQGAAWDPALRSVVSSVRLNEGCAVRLAAATLAAQKLRALGSADIARGTPDGQAAETVKPEAEDVVQLLGTICAPLWSGPRGAALGAVLEQATRVVLVPDSIIAALPWEAMAPLQAAAAASQLPIERALSVATAIAAAVSTASELQGSPAGSELRSTGAAFGLPPTWWRSSVTFDSEVRWRRSWMTGVLG